MFSMSDQFGKIKANEHTIRSFWKDYLVDSFRGKNIQIIYDPTIKKQKGVKFPDFYVINQQYDTKFIVETKLGDDNYDDAIVDGVEKMNLINADASIAVCFPRSLENIVIQRVKEMMPAIQGYKAQIRFNRNKYSVNRNKENLKSNASYSELNKLIIALIEEDLKESEKEKPSINKLIEILNDNVNLLFQELQFTSDEDITTILGGKTLFENILGFGSNEVIKNKENLTKIISYLFISQLLFYFKIQFWFPSFEEITAFNISKLEDIINRFHRVSEEKDWQPIFNYDILSVYIGSPNEDKIFALIRLILLDIQSIIMDMPDELLGIIFHQLIPLDVRKIVAAYYTTIPTSNLLSNLAIDKYNVQVIDLACGSGNLLTAAYRRKRSLFEKEKGAFSSSDHQKFVENDIYGIDIMPFATMLTTINLSLQAPTAYTNKIKIGTEDSTNLKPGDTIYPILEALKKHIIKYRKITEFIKDEKKKKITRIEKGAISMDGTPPEPILISTYDLVIMNPPFTKNENLSKIKFKTYKKVKNKNKEVTITYKDLLADRFSNYKDLINRRMGLFAYFVLLADKFLRINGKIAFVLPASFLRIKACEKIRMYLADHYEINFIVYRTDQSNFSENTALREILFIATKIKKGENHNSKCIYVKLLSLPTDDRNIERLAQSVINGTKFNDVEYTEFSQIALKKMYRNWFLPISLTTEIGDIWKKLIENPLMVDYLTVIPRENIIRGLDSTNKKELFKFFIVDEKHLTSRDLWVFKGLKASSIRFQNNHKKIDDFLIPSVCVVRGLRSTANLKNMNIKDLNDYIIVNEFPHLREVISDAFNINANEVDYSELNKWNEKVINRTSNTFHIRRFDLTAPGTIHIGYYSELERAPTGLTWVFKYLDEYFSKYITLWNNCSIHILQVLIYRKETRGGFMAIDSYNFEDYKVPNPNCIDDEAKKNCLSLFTELSNIEFPSIKNQLENNFEGRKKLDEFFLSLIFPTQNIEQFGISLREKLLQEIKNLKKQMNGD